MDKFVAHILGAIRFPTPKEASTSTDSVQEPAQGELGWTSQTSEPDPARKDPS